MQFGTSLSFDYYIRNQKLNDSLISRTLGFVTVFLTSSPKSTIWGNSCMRVVRLSFERCVLHINMWRRSGDKIFLCQVDGTAYERLIVRVGNSVATFPALRIAQFYNMKRRKLGRQFGLQLCKHETRTKF
ncbi:hypothetical protein M404DRAFT_617842 [Pisolithus tinctorius Marx 270]|uniref:Uncharacterized protein n=1 Tax=Pisolithus tinctorius Marx 270 TaxID=870435 RepID=A0A0C3P6Z9_PISTI|nr:hypothetical protein M404DRAFT_617842 [Pisolithus tinctorius Marx 270]